jgi:hypothetical protein
LSKSHKTIVLMLISVLCASVVLGSNVTYASWSVEVLGGSAAHMSLPVKIQMKGSEDINIKKPVWETQPFQEAPYYSVRAAKWNENSAIEFEIIHDKMILTNPSGDVTHFEVSHGYNYFLLNKVFKKDSLILRLGAGAIVSHPEATIADVKFGDFDLLKGFDLSGVGGQAALQYNFDLTNSLYIMAEAKLTGAWARVPLQVKGEKEPRGSATVPAAAIHGLFGMGYKW